MQKDDKGILADLPSGKLSKQSVRKDLKGQLGYTCLLYAIRRLSSFKDSPEEVKSAGYYIAYKYIKNTLSTFNPNRDSFQTLMIVMKNACYIVGLEPEELLGGTENYTYLRQIPDITWSMLYTELLKAIFPKFGMQIADWKPSNDIESLKNSLKTNGAMIFGGKYGANYYSCKPIRQKKFDTKLRKVYFFKKGTFTHEDSWGHAVVVDQIKKIAGIDVIFFRDPQDSSNINKKEKVYMLRYTTFIEHMEILFNGRTTSAFTCYASMRQQNMA